MSNIKPYIALLKSRLSMTVAFSGTFGYILAPIKHEPLGIFLISLAGFLLTGAANIVNQLKEIPYDKLMKRTANRPLPTETLNSKQASIFGYILVVAALALLSYFSWKSAALGFLSYLLYGYVYTPLKRVGPISVFVGAFPGAFPPMIGWVAATEHFGWEPGILFAIQFFWQFPHFWAIAWVSHTDYSKVGFKLLPADKGPTKFTALQAVMYAVLMVPIGFLPNYFKITGEWSMWVVLVANIFMVVQCVRLYQNMGVPAARRVMFSSYIYLPIVYLALMANKI